MADLRKLRLFRGTRSGGELKEYQVAAGEGMVVLDAVHAIQAEQAPDLAVRWNCKAGKCGSCSAEINGKPRLMCMTRMSDYAPDGTWRMQQYEVERPQEFRKCIECFLCQDVCHVLRAHDKHAEFMGPAMLVRAAVYEMHPLDEADRRPFLREQGGIGYCNITKCCTEVCPESITITDNAIIPLKERVADAYFDPIAKLLGKVLG